MIKHKSQRVEDAHLDHRVPHSKGGDNSWENAQITHAYCNLYKNNKMPVGVK